MHLDGRYSADGFDGRLDRVFGPERRLFVRTTRKRISDSGTAGNAAYDPVLGATESGSSLWNLTASYSQVVTPDVINEVRAGLSRANYDTTFPMAAEGDSIVSALGISGLPGAPLNGLGGVPVFNFPGLFGGSTNPAGHPRQMRNSIFELNDRLMWISGHHELSAGFELRRLGYQDNIFYLAGDEYGDYFFNGAYTGGGGDAHAFAGLLLGIVDTANQAQNQAYGQPFGYHYGGWVQDVWRLGRTLSLSAGLRYEVNRPFDDKTHQLGNFDTAYPGGRLVVQGETGMRLVSPAWRAQVNQTFSVPFVTNGEIGWPATLRQTCYRDLQPRLGLTWNARPRTTFRAAARHLHRAAAGCGELRHARRRYQQLLGLCFHAGRPAESAGTVHLSRHQPRLPGLPPDQPVRHAPAAGDPVERDA